MIYIVNFFSVFSVRNLLTESLKIINFVRIPIKLFIHNAEAFFDKKEETKRPKEVELNDQSEYDDIHNNDHDVTAIDQYKTNGDMKLNCDDFAILMKRFGIIGWRHEEFTGCVECNIDDCEEHSMLLEQVDEFLQKKIASLHELKEAFYVFDRNEDGFITADELWCVLKRLGLQGKMIKLEDCKKMIQVFDVDGDERINFEEFKTMLENVY